jgi:hypothetical protein
MTTNRSEAADRVRQSSASGATTVLYPVYSSAQPAPGQNARTVLYSRSERAKRAWRPGPAALSRVSCVFLVGSGGPSARSPKISRAFASCFGMVVISNISHNLKISKPKLKSPDAHLIFIPHVIIIKMMILQSSPSSSSLIQTHHMVPRPRSLKRRISNSIDVIPSNTTLDGLSSVCTTNQLAVNWDLHDTKALSKKFRVLAVPTKHPVNKHRALGAIITFMME